MSGIIILDYIAAQAAQSIVEGDLPPKEIENLSTKALGVLQEQGVYACYLFLFYQVKDGSPATHILYHLWNVMGKIDIKVPVPDCTIPIVELKDAKLISYAPRSFKFDLKTQFKNEQEAQKMYQRISEHINTIKNHWKLWEVNQKIPELSSRIPKIENFTSLNYKISEKNGKWILECSNANLHEVLVNLPTVREIILADISWITTDLNLLLFIRQLYEQILIYTRYHAKALND